MILDDESLLLTHKPDTAPELPDNDQVAYEHVKISGSLAASASEFLIKNFPLEKADSHIDIDNTNVLSIITGDAEDGGIKESSGVLEKLATEAPAGERHIILYLPFETRATEAMVDLYDLPHPSEISAHSLINNIERITGWKRLGSN